jgi:hypothetical protein
MKPDLARKNLRTEDLAVEAGGVAVTKAAAAVVATNR